MYGLYCSVFFAAWARAVCSFNAGSLRACVILQLWLCFKLAKFALKLLPLVLGLILVLIAVLSEERD